MPKIIETEEKGILRDMDSKALLPTTRDPRYQKYLNAKRKDDRIKELEDKLDRALSIIEKLQEDSD